MKRNAMVLLFDRRNRLLIYLRDDKLRAEIVDDFVAREKEL